MKTRLLLPLALLVLVALPATRAASELSGRSDLSDAQVKEEMARRASLLCPGYSTDRGMPGINAVKVDALRVFLSHKFTVCPDRRILAPQAVVWDSRYGVMLWNPGESRAVNVLAARADLFTHNMEFPDELMVYDLENKPMKNQVVKAFEPRDTFTGFN